MEQTTHHIHTTPPTIMTNFISVICYFIAFSCEILKDISGEDIYNFFFRFLSIISVSFVIIINWPKVKEIITNSLKKRKDGNNTRKKR